MCVHCASTTPQSIIEEEGGLNNQSGKSGGGDSARDSEDQQAPAGDSELGNWDQPLIIAEPDVKVRACLVQH
jgi:hypothetical protein